MAWSVKISANAEAQLQQAIEVGDLTLEDQEIIKEWILGIIENGPQSIRGSNYWNDHALEGKWFGYRSSSFSYTGRIIYRFRKRELVVEVVRITTSHNYR